MNRLLCIPLFAFALALPAQHGGDAKKPQDPPKAGKGADKKESEKPDPALAKDPAITQIDKFIAKNGVSKKDEGWRTHLPQPSLVPYDPKTEYFWNVETNKGLLVVKLFPDTAPMHVTVGIYLSRLGFYDGLKFHRVLKGFMAQGGCPNGNGSGGPGFQIDGEFYGNRQHDKPGMLSTANTGLPKTDGSQFFLTFVPTPHLDGKHTLWGEVVEGLDVLKAIEAEGLAPEEDGKAMANPPSITRTWITIKKEAPKAKAKPGEAPPAESPKGDKSKG